MPPVKYDPNTLWVALSEYSDGNVFEVYPKLLAELFLQEEAARQVGDTSEAEKLILPSDKDYRLQKYFTLVALQKDLEEQVSWLKDYLYVMCKAARNVQNNVYTTLFCTLPLP